MAREGYEAPRGNEKKRRSARETCLYLGAFFICRDLFYDTHARTNSDQDIDRRDGGSRYGVPGRVEKCDIP